MSNEDHLLPLSESLNSTEMHECQKLDQWIEELHIATSSPTQDPTSTDDIYRLANQLQQVGDQVAEQCRRPNSIPTNLPQIDGYVLESMIGKGGMGVVYRAIDLELKRTVAIKVLPEHIIATKKAKQRFRLEVQAAAQLDHPNIVPVYAFGEYAGGLFYTMREIAGIDLARKLREEGSTDEGGQSAGPEIQPQSRDYRRWVATVGKQIAEALAHSHEQLIIHRDVKPANVLIDQDGNALLSDFGLARVSTSSDLTGTDDVMGTVLYMSPEQTSGDEHVDSRTDVYSLGITLYEMCTGRSAITESSFGAAWRQINDGLLVPPRQINANIERDLETIILKAISPEPGSRYATAAELAADLGRFLDVRPIHARRPTYSMRVARWARRNSRWVTALGVVVACLLTVIFGLSIYSANQSSKNASIVREQNAELLDMAGVDLLEKGDVFRAAQRFAESADFSEQQLAIKQQQRRISAIRAWSPVMQQSIDYPGEILARLDNQRTLLRMRESGKQQCVLMDNGKRKQLFETERSINFARIDARRNLVLFVIGDRTNLNPELKLYDVDRQHLRTIAAGITWRITDAWLLPDSETFVTTGWGGSASTWNYVQDREVCSVEFPTEGNTPSWVYSARADSRRTVMIAATNPGRLMAYSLPDLNPVWDEPAQLATWTVDALAISNDGRWTAAGTAKDGIRLWHIASGREIVLANNLAGEPTTATFSADSRSLAVGDDRGDVYLWQLPEDSEERQLSSVISRKGRIMHHDHAITSLSFNGTGDLLVASGQSARVWRTLDHQPLTPLISRPSPLTYARWIDDHTMRLASREAMRDVHSIWKLPPSFQSSQSQEGTIVSLLSAGSNQHIDLVASIESESSQNSNLKVVKLSSEQGPSMNQIHVSRALVQQGLAISSSTNRLAAIAPHGEGFQLHVFDLQTLLPARAPIDLPRYLQNPVLNHDGTRWMANDFNQHLVVGSVAEGNTLFRYKLPSWLVATAFLADGHFGAISWDHKLRVWNKAGSEVAEFEQASRPELLATSRNMVVVAATQNLHVYHLNETERWEETAHLITNGETHQRLVVGPQAERWLSCGSQGLTRLWSGDSELLNEFSTDSPIADAQFSTDGRWFATVSESGSVQVRESSSGSIMGPTIRAPAPIQFLSWSDSGLKLGGQPTSRRILGCSGEDTRGMAKLIRHRTTTVFECLAAGGHNLC